MLITENNLKCKYFFKTFRTFFKNVFMTFMKHFMSFYYGDFYFNIEFNINSPFYWRTFNKKMYSLLINKRTRKNNSYEQLLSKMFSNASWIFISIISQHIMYNEMLVSMSMSCFFENNRTVFDAAFKTRIFYKNVNLTTTTTKKYWWWTCNYTETFAFLKNVMLHIFLHAKMCM